MSRVALSFMFLASILAGAAGCAAESADDNDTTATGEDALKVRADDEWFYGGPLTAVQNADITVSLKGSTAHLVGYYPAGTTVPSLPHLQTSAATDGRVRVDIVYPIATAADPSNNSGPGTYRFQGARPYRPDGIAYTVSAGEHFVPWGGFPFLAYNGGIAFHGPITQEGNGVPDMNVFYLRRGQVSSGCNRMMGEHVTELAHLIGVSMHKVYTANQTYTPPSAPRVHVISDYDKLGDKWIDVDYATDTGVTRPGKVYGSDKVVMFGSWVASETADGRDLPPDMKWEAGVTGKPYHFADHARNDMICSVAKSDRTKLSALQTALGGELPQNFCAKKDCIVSAFHANKDAKATCGL